MKLKKSSLLKFFFLLLIIYPFLMSCGILFNFNTSGNRIMITPGNTNIDLGQTSQFKAYLYEEHGEIADVTDTASWSISNESTASVTGNGQVLGKNIGWATLGAVLDEMAATSSIAITYPAGTVWFVPERITTGTSSTFEIGVHVSTGTIGLDSYTLTLHYKPIEMVFLRADPGPEGIVSGSSYFDSLGIVVISGRPKVALSSGSDMDLLRVTLQNNYLTEPYALTLEIDELADSSANTIGTPSPYNTCLIEVDY